MLIGRLQSGRLVVSYESEQELIAAKSCTACTFYNETKPCGYYGDCRAGNRAGEDPSLFTFVGLDTIRRRIDTERKENGPKQL